MRKRTAASVILLILMMINVVVMPFLPWYVVSAPEVPARDGHLVLLYVDRSMEYYIRNGTYYPGLEAYWSGPYETQDAIPVFTGSMVLNVLVAIFSGIMIAILLARDRPKLRRWMLIFLAILGWVAAIYFVVSLSHLLTSWNRYFPGFFGSKYAEWADAWTYYGPGIGWYLMLTNSILATLILPLHTSWKPVLPWRSRKKKDITKSDTQPENP